MEIIRLNSKIYNLNKLRYLTPIKRLIKDVEKYRFYVDNTLKIQCNNLGISVEDVLHNSLEPEEFLYYGFTFVFEQDNEELCFPTLEQAKKGYKQAIGITSVIKVAALTVSGVRVIVDDDRVSPIKSVEFSIMILLSIKANVRCSFLRVYRSTSNHAFQCPIADHNASTEIIGIDKGNMIPNITMNNHINFSQFN